MGAEDLVIISLKTVNFQYSLKCFPFPKLLGCLEHKVLV